MSTAIDDGCTYLDLSVTVEPLLSQHDDGRGGEGSSQAGVKDGLNVDDSRIGASPLRDSGIVTGWDVPKRNIGHDHEELETPFRNRVIGYSGRRK